jgi:hypothetical protein
LAFAACVADPPSISGGNDGADAATSSSGSATDGGPSSAAASGNGASNPPSGDSDSGSCANAADAGGVTCGGDNPICCGVQPLGGGYGPSTVFACATNAATCTTNAGGVVIGCRDRLDCPGSEVCCGHKMSDDASAYASVQCETSCDVDSNAYLFCDPGDPNACADQTINTRCDSEGILPGLFVCQYD